MRMLLAAVMLLASAMAAAEDARKAVSIAVEPLGDRGDSVVAQVVFRFANPRAMTEAGLFLDGTVTQAGQVPRHFRVSVPRTKDKLIWINSLMRNGKAIRRSGWTFLPDRRNEAAMRHTFTEGEAQIEVRLVLDGDYGNPSRVVAESTATVRVAKTSRPFAENVEETAEEIVPEKPKGPVTLHPPWRSVSGLHVVGVDVLPPVKRVEFRVAGKRVLARNAPPYTAELDLGDTPNGVVIEAIGYDAAGRYVDADTFTVTEEE
jgi:hypothetical protein